VVRGEQPTLPDAVFAHALTQFVRERAMTTQTVPVDTIAFAPGSPGRIFNLTEDAFLARLERLDRSTGGGLVYDETAGLRQVLIHGLPGPLQLLDSHYAATHNRLAAAAAG
jgi:hypothetical protein